MFYGYCTDQKEHLSVFDTCHRFICLVILPFHDYRAIQLFPCFSQMGQTLLGSLTCWTRRTSWWIQTSSTFHPRLHQYTPLALITTTEVMAVR